MNNTRLSRRTDKAKGEFESIIDELVQEIEELESDKDKMQDEIEKLNSIIEEMADKLNKLEND